MDRIDQLLHTGRAGTQEQQRVLNASLNAELQQQYLAWATTCRHAQGQHWPGDAGWWA